MRDVNRLNNRELDELAERADTTQGQAVLGKVYEYLGRFVVYPSVHARTAHATWILHTHLMDRWDATPRLFFQSVEKASGKSRALEATEPLVPFPVTAVNVSPAYLFRKVGAEEGATILHDEIDTVFGDKANNNEEIRALLNAGHRRGAVAGRCVVHGKTVTTEEIPAYAAVALAGLGWVPDTILSRSIIVRMRRRRADEQVQPFRRRIAAPEGEEIRRLIEVWARTVPAEIDWPEMPPEIQDRDADVWEPLVAVADIVGGDWPRRVREAAKVLIQVAKEAEPGLGILLLTDLRTIFGNTDKLPTETLLQRLREIEEAPWGDMKGKLLDSRGLARRLREYGIKSRTLRIGPATPRGYERSDFLDAWSRYLSPLPPTSATSKTSATVAEISETVAPGAPRKPPKIGHVAHVADVALLGGRETDRGMNGHHVAQHSPNPAQPEPEPKSAAMAPAKLEMPDLPACLRRNPPPCAQCNSNDGQQTQRQLAGDLIWLHNECMSFWLRERET